MRSLFALPVLAALALPAGAASVPGALHIGEQPLAAASCAVRDTLWIHHYVAALYVRPQEPPTAALPDPDEPKALLVQILNRSFLPREIPRKWREALEQELDPIAIEAIRAAWRTLSVGDLVLIAYVPSQGVTLELNDRVIAGSRRHEVVERLLSTWADNEPVTQRIKRTVAKHPCR